MIRQSMVLAAGMGKRLQPLTLTTPKPMIPLKGIPLLQYTLDRLVGRQLDKIVINTHYLAEQIAIYLEDRPVIISHEAELLETGGGIAKALPHFGNQPFFSLNSDIWWQETSGNILDDLEQSWDDRSMDALLVLVPHANALNFPGPGDFFWEAATLTPTFRASDCAAPYIYTGIQLLHPRLFENCPAGAFSIVDLYRRAHQKNKLKAIILEGVWSDIGTLDALEALRQRVGHV
ncbi:MAG: nucleotidyltransferase family protein [Candidatus Paracaedibacteraceae bacterium]|nr:nucleotidyltransferase family protein [Candidatus Paracaedibacteraceae bacterium]